MLYTDSIILAIEERAVADHHVLGRYRVLRFEAGAVEVHPVKSEIPKGLGTISDA